MRIGLLADTHGYFDKSLTNYLEECDEIWHAGDWGPGVLEELEKLKPIRGVYGNIDGRSIRDVFPRDLSFECEGLRVFMTHIGGYPGRYNKRVKKILLEERPGLFICGHSHILKVIYDQQLEILHMNPGACGRHGFHQVRTIIRFSISSSKVSDAEVVELGPRAMKSHSM